MRIDIEIPAEATPGRHGIYILSDGQGNVLYIGRTQNLHSRLRNHRCLKPWWKSVRALEWVACDGPNEARLVEKELIGLYRPEDNRVDHVLPAGSVRQKLPDWAASKLVELQEAAAGSAKGSLENSALNSYIAALREAGWTLSAIGLPLSLSRQGVSNRQAAATTTRTPFGVPAVPKKVKPAKPKPLEIPADVLARMKALHVDARQVRGWTPLDSPLREASVRLTELIAEQVIAGVKVAMIARQLGVTHLAVRARLARHGYTEPVKGLDQTAYGTPFTRNGPRTHCNRGHEMSGDNLYLVGGDTSRRVCRACDSIRSAKYHAKRKQAAS